MLQALVILYQLREVALATGGYLNLVLFRANCCCFEPLAAGRAYSHLLLVQKSKRHILTYLLYYDTRIPPALLPFCWSSKRQEISF